MPPAVGGRRRLVLAAAGAVVALGVAGCGAGGPADLQDGDYRFLASSAGTATDAGLVVAGAELTVSSARVEDTSTLGEEADEAELCPGGGTGRPVRLDTPLTIGTVRLTSPAVYGDCGVTTPVRVTLVDLDSRTDGRPPYDRWVEFCLGSDPDCSS